MKGHSENAIVIPQNLYGGNMNLVLTLIVVLLVLFAGFVRYRAFHFNKSVKKEIQEIANQSTGDEKPPSMQRTKDMPEPVARYLDLAIARQPGAIRFTRLFQEGSFRMNPGTKWMPMSASQYLFSHPMASVWSGKTSAAPMLWIRARDKYEQGGANMRIMLLSTFRVADITGEKMHISALSRYLSELVWLPTSLVPKDNLRWEAVDETSARAYLSDGHIEVSALFWFDRETGLPNKVESTDKYRSVGRKMHKNRWTGYFGKWENTGGFLVPMEGSAQWNLPEGDMTYVRFAVSDIRFSTA